MPTHYHISCRVRNSDAGIDATPTEHADEIIECSGTAFAALTKWLLNKDSWLHATPEAIKTLVDKMNQETEQKGRSELEIMGWDSHDDGGMTNSNDWETGQIDIDEEKHSLEMYGTSCLSEFEFEIKVKPVEPMVIKGYDEEEDE
jgi:hypothetical protein